MSKRNVRLLLCACPLIAASSAGTTPFVGDWKLNPSKSTLTDRMKVESVGRNIYQFDFGGGAETIVVDGTDQPTPLNKDGTLSVGLEGDTWKVVRKANGRTILTAIWSLSRDGNSLTDRFTSFNADGSAYQLNYVYVRKAGGSGLAGTWVSTSMKAVNYVVVIRLRPYEEDGLSIIDESSQFTGNMNFAASSVRRLNERTLVLMRTKDDSAPSDFLRLELSADLRTLTVTPRLATGAEPHLFVFDRQ
jgi:hypothetical protein